MRRWLVPAAIGIGTAGAFAVVAMRTGGEMVSAATSPDWGLLAAAFAVAAVVQPLRALAWRSTLRDERVGFKAIYAASAVGSFIDTVAPARLGEVSKVAVLRAAAGSRWPGVPRAGGSLLCAHLLEAMAFALVGAAAAVFLPFPGWARWTLIGALGAAGGGIGVAALLHRHVGRFLPEWMNGFLAGASAPPRVLARTGAILVATWLARWGGILLLLNAFGVEATAAVALVYMIVTGLANTVPVLPGNAGLYQGAAVGALALVGETTSKALAVSVAAPVVAMVGTALAALIGLALYGRRFGELRRAALSRA